MEKAKELAKLGFVALAADVYGKGKRAATIESGMALVAPLRDDRRNLLRKYLLAAYNALKGVDGVNGDKVREWKSKKGWT